VAPAARTTGNIDSRLLPSQLTACTGLVYQWDGVDGGDVDPVSVDNAPVNCLTCSTTSSAYLAIRNFLDPPTFLTRDLLAGVTYGNATQLEATEPRNV